MRITHMFLISASASEIWVVNEQEAECKHIGGNCSKWFPIFNACGVNISVIGKSEIFKA